ncbi:hypothetical protein DHB64_12425 [Antarcticibacterium sp. W02-3]|nr:hypothetical protein [Antarcticibacterium sp. W02-3]
MHSPLSSLHFFQPTTHNRQPTTDNPQPTTHNRQPTTDNPQPTTHNLQPTTFLTDTFRVGASPTPTA